MYLHIITTLQSTKHYFYFLYCNIYVTIFTPKTLFSPPTGRLAQEAILTTCVLTKMIVIMMMSELQQLQHPETKDGWRETEREWGCWFDSQKTWHLKNYLRFFAENHDCTLMAFVTIWSCSDFAFFLFISCYAVMVQSILPQNVPPSEFQRNRSPKNLIWTFAEFKCRRREKQLQPLNTGEQTRALQTFIVQQQK